MKYEKRLSLKTIAYELGVSVNTVSRALRDCDDISESTKEKVRKVTNFFLRFPHKLPKYTLKKPYLYTQR